MDGIVRTTLALPIELLEAADLAVQKGKAKSRNEFVTQALRRELAAQKRAEIDAAFASMADDIEYQTEAVMISNEFVKADWEAFEIGEQLACTFIQTHHINWFVNSRHTNSL